ncbi:MAG: hypothetical protein F4138_03515 [Acidimicrobiia bacterium]|nr:hypothetical protein [Acidimicrobiia bacterium]
MANSRCSLGSVIGGVPSMKEPISVFEFWVVWILTRRQMHMVQITIVAKPVVAITCHQSP